MDLTTKPVAVEGLAHSAGVAAQPPKSSGAVCGYCGGKGVVQVGTKGGFAEWAVCSACGGNHGIRAK